MKFVVVCWFDEALPAFDGEHDMEKDLRVGVGHEPKMPLLTELEKLFLFWFHKDVAPMALSATSSIPQVIGERVFVRHLRVENAGELWSLVGEFRELERAPVFRG